MKIHIKNIKKCKDEETIRKINDEYYQVMAHSVDLNLRMIQKEKEGDNSEVERLKEGMKLLVFNTAIIKKRKEEYSSDELIRKIDYIDYCCEEMKGTYETGDLYYINKDTEQMELKNGTIYGEVFSEDVVREVRFCQYCGKKVEFYLHKQV